MDGLDDDEEMSNLKKRHYSMIKSKDEKTTEKKMKFGPVSIKDRDIDEIEDTKTPDDYVEYDFSWKPTKSMDELDQMKPKGY